MAEKDNNNFIWLYHRYRSVKTVEDFMEREHIYNIEPKDFFEMNRELIWQQYTDYDKGIEKAGTGKWPESADDLVLDSWLPCPCNLKIQATKVTAELAISQTNFQSETGDFYSFASDEIANIIQDGGYQIAEAVKRNPVARVYGWFKSMYFVHSMKNDGLSYTLNDDFFDISQFIISLSTLQAKEGGSFSLRLPIVNIFKYANGIGIDDQDIVWSGTPSSDFKNDGSSYRNLYLKDEEFYSKNQYGELESNYFNWLISSNDLLFISFEQLEMEEDSEKDELRTRIANGVFDMIALVDDVKVVADSAGANGYVEITGRDLMKLLIEDGSFFFNPSTTSDPSNIFMNEQSYGKQGDIREADQINNTYNNPINRLRRVTGEIDIFANRINMDLSYILKGVISQLSNVEVVPGFVFDAWGEKRTTYLELQPLRKEETNGNN
jgi:hypothetical protein